MQPDVLVELQDDLVTICLAAVAVSVLWLVVLAATALGLRRSPELAAHALRRLGAPRLLVHLLLVLVGVGLTVPAQAAEGSGPSGRAADPVGVAAGTSPAGRLAAALDGLPSPALPAPGPAVRVAPDRTVVEPATPTDQAQQAEPADRAEQRQPARGTHRVTDGESLWSISAARLPRADDAAVDRAWRALYAANRTAVGPDPDVMAVDTRLDITSLTDDQDPTTSTRSTP